ncbi:hypothetical protein CVT24_013167 [Panaeolus cyanescens]|uniref:Uncharacterized protein n=1 Tax=Panaeolus cyanescens TaxID=181874 RepID=A0A409X280_9AGAR|nr:hypothetical protein CVT24_013167 [Panaeolus cyanescens]
MGLSVDDSLYSESYSKTKAPTHLPMLDEDGTNSITWRDIVYGELLARGLFDNLEGLTIEALCPVVKDGKTYSATDTEFSVHDSVRRECCGEDDQGLEELGEEPRYIESQGKLKAEDIFKEALIASLPTDVFGPTMDTMCLSYETTGKELTIETIIEKVYDHWESLHGPDALRKEFVTTASGSTALASSKSSDGAKKGKRPKCTTIADR